MKSKFWHDLTLFIKGGFVLLLPIGIMVMGMNFKIGLVLSLIGVLAIGGFKLIDKLKSKTSDPNLTNEKGEGK